MPIEAQIGCLSGFELIKYKSHISTSEELKSNSSKCNYTYVEALELCGPLKEVSIKDA
jgi:hypothetical protein